VLLATKPGSVILLLAGVAETQAALPRILAALRQRGFASGSCADREARRHMRRSDLGYVNVIDVETTCWEDGPPAGEEQEIIEIGLCVVRVKTATVAESVSILVRPKRSTVSAFCTGLTTLTPEAVSHGMPFEEACERLVNQYESRQRVWASYGDFDRAQFERQCRSFGVAFPFGLRHLNVKTWLGLCLGLSHEVGMARALDLLDMPLTGTHHRGGDDARNIAGILLALLTAARGRLQPQDRSPG
jgi:inhibitor of KinA sporulation pathway (predicted exonuclease)